ncbi:MAG: heavy metal-associated domain-containing protein [Planctomycetota bacterium]
MITLPALLLAIATSPAPAAPVTAAPATPSADQAEAKRVLPQGVIELYVVDLHCKTCAKKLARKLYATPGVKRVQASVKQNRAVITLQPRKQVDLAKIWRAAELAEQKPVTLLVLDKKLTADDFEKVANKQATRATRR